MAGNSAVGYLIGLMISIIILVQAVLPTVQDAINTGNFTGTTGTLINLIPVFLAIGGIVMVVAFMRIK